MQSRSFDEYNSAAEEFCLQQAICNENKLQNVMIGSVTSEGNTICSRYSIENILEEQTET